MPRGGHPAPGSSRKSSRLRAPSEHKIEVFVRFCQQVSSRWHPRPATNLIRRRRALRCGYPSGAPGPDLLTRSIVMRPLPHLIIYMRILLCCHIWAAAQTDANLSAHLHRLPTPPPYLRQMRLSPGRGAGVECRIRLQLGGCVVRANHRAHFQNINI